MTSKISSTVFTASTSNRPLGMMNGILHVVVKLDSVPLRSFRNGSTLDLYVFNILSAGLMNLNSLQRSVCVYRRRIFRFGLVAVFRRNQSPANLEYGVPRSIRRRIGV